MKKKITFLLAVMFIATIFVAAKPDTEVYAKTTYEFTYDEVISYWSAQPLFTQIFYAESNKAPYIYDVRANITKYFAASLVDTVMHPADVQSQRPLTYKYCTDVLSLSNPSIPAIIRNGGQAFTLQEVLLEEMKQVAPYLTYEDRAHNVPILVAFLNDQGVYTVPQYTEWKKQHDGKTAFEVYIHMVKDLSDLWGLAQKEYVKEVLTQQEAAQQEAYEQAKAAQEYAENQAKQAYQQQQAYEQQLKEQYKAMFN